MCVKRTIVGDMNYLSNTVPGGGDFIPSLPGCVCPKVMDMGPFWASSE